MIKKPMFRPLLKKQDGGKVATSSPYGKRFVVMPVGDPNAIQTTQTIDLFSRKGIPSSEGKPTFVYNAMDQNGNKSVVPESIIPLNYLRDKNNYGITNYKNGKPSSVDSVYLANGVSPFNINLGMKRRGGIINKYDIGGPYNGDTDPVQTISTPRNIGFAAPPQVLTGKPISMSPVTVPKKTPMEIKSLNDSFNFMPLAANAVLSAFSNGNAQRQQDDYMYNNLANPMNYLPRNDSNNEWINKGTVMAQQGMIVGSGPDDEETEPDFNSLFPNGVQQDEEEPDQPEQDSPYAAQEIADASMADQPESQEAIQMYEPSTEEEDSVDDEPNINNSPEVAAMYNPIPANNIDANAVMGMKGADKRIAHNNPGNIHMSEFAEKYGAKEGRPDIGGKVAIFPSMEVGMKAMKDLIFSKNYNDLTVREARRRWVGHEDNSENPIVRAMGGNKKLSSLSEPEKNKLVSQFVKWEDDAVYKKLKDSGVVQ